MTPEQWIALLSTLLDGLSKIGIGAIAGAVLTLWIQNSNERQRLQARRQAQVDGRNINRKWTIKDREIDTKMAQLLSHKQAVEGYLNNVLSMSSHLRMNTAGLEKYTIKNTTPSYLKYLK